MELKIFNKVQWNVGHNYGVVLLKAFDKDSA